MHFAWFHVKWAPEEEAFASSRIPHAWARPQSTGPSGWVWVIALRHPEYMVESLKTISMTEDQYCLSWHLWDPEAFCVISHYGAQGLIFLGPSGPKFLHTLKVSAIRLSLRGPRGISTMAQHLWGKKHSSVIPAIMGPQSPGPEGSRAPTNPCVSIYTHWCLKVGPLDYQQMTEHHIHLSHL